MQIFKVQRKETKPFSSINNKTESIAFKGALTRIAQKTPNVSSDMMRALKGVHIREKGFVGIFPQEFLQAIRNNLGSSVSRQKIKESVEGTKAAFSKAAKLFEEIEKLTLENIDAQVNKLDLNKSLDILKQRLELSLSPNLNKIEKWEKKIRKLVLPNKDIIHQVEKNASEILEKELKKNNVLSESARVVVKRLDNGKFGTAYKISFLDEKNQKLFKDKVMKYYKKSDYITKLDVLNKYNTNLNLKDAELIHLNYDKVVSSVGKMFDLFIKKGLKDGPILKHKVLSQIDMVKNMPMDEFVSNLNRRIQGQKISAESKYGINKEANFGNYIRKNIGHNLQHTDLVQYHYTDLNSNYALLDFSNSKTLGSVRSSVDYKSLGIENTDMALNFVDNRLIDYGGFITNNPILSNNPVSRRIYKKIKQINYKNSETETMERIAKFNELYDKAIKNKLPQSSDVLIGLDEAKLLIPENKRHLLYINKDM